MICAIMEFKRVCKLPFSAIDAASVTSVTLSWKQAATVYLHTKEVFPKALKPAQKEVILSRIPH